MLDKSAKMGPWDFRKADKTDHILAKQELWLPEKPVNGARGITREEVALHNSKDDCWIIISGKVYDITEWAPHHPGGGGIARMYAGKEATAEFGDYHSADAVAHMRHFCVGEIIF